MRSYNEIINRRSPVIDYLQCHDVLRDDRNKKQTDYIFALIDGGENPSIQMLNTQRELRLKYEEAEVKLQELSSCPDLPN